MTERDQRASIRLFTDPCCAHFRLSVLNPTQSQMGDLMRRANREWHTHVITPHCAHESGKPLQTRVFHRLFSINLEESSQYEALWLHSISSLSTSSFAVYPWNGVHSAFNLISSPFSSSTQTSAECSLTLHAVGSTLICLRFFYACFLPPSCRD